MIPFLARPSTSQLVDRLWAEDRADQLAQRRLNEELYLKALKSWFEKHDEVRNEAK